MRMLSLVVSRHMFAWMAGTTLLGDVSFSNHYLCRILAINSVMSIDTIIQRELFLEGLLSFQWWQCFCWVISMRRLWQNYVGSSLRVWPKDRLLVISVTKNFKMREGIAIARSRGGNPSIESKWVIPVTRQESTCYKTARVKKDSSSCRCLLPKATVGIWFKPYNHPISIIFVLFAIMTDLEVNHWPGKATKWWKAYSWRR